MTALLPLFLVVVVISMAEIGRRNPQGSTREHDVVDGFWLGMLLMSAVGAAMIPLLWLARL